MNDTKKMKCPHCKGVNTVNIQEELKSHKEITLRGLSRHDIEIPKAITIKCSNCNKIFKINM